ncbi:MAG TPA: CoA-transferase [Candidatus Dormibacteraeota bacterium]|nr:CoA-transferase [Candidatus Dormibacteraeota bacterium]
MTDKVCSAADAVHRLVPNGCRVLAVGGMHLHNNPMALVFELVRQKRRIARLVTSPSASLNADVLIGAGLTGEVATSYVGFEHLGLAPRFRSAAEAGTLKVLDLCEAAITHGLHAGASGLPFAVLPQGLELADVWRANPESYRMIVDPFSQEPVLVVSAIRPDVTVIHAAEADEQGTTWLAGAHFTDRIMAMAARTVIVQVERVVSTESMSRRPAGSTLPGFLVTAVVESAGGCLPTSSHGNYPYDEPAIKEYLNMARTAEGFEEWMSRAAPERLAGVSAK